MGLIKDKYQVTLVGECFIVLCSKTCAKRPLENRQNKDLNDKWKLNEGHKYCRMLPLGEFCITFDLHLAIIGIENQFSAFLRVAVLHRTVLLPLWDSVIVLFFAMRYFMSILVLQSS